MTEHNGHMPVEDSYLKDCADLITDAVIECPMGCLILDDGEKNIDSQDPVRYIDAVRYLGNEKSGT